MQGVNPIKIIVGGTAVLAIVIFGGILLFANFGAERPVA